MYNIEHGVLTVFSQWRSRHAATIAEGQERLRTRAVVSRILKCINCDLYETAASLTLLEGWDASIDRSNDWYTPT